jgi:hypothetical protein
MSKMKKQEILKNQLIQKAQQYFTNIASIFELIEIQKICLFICSFCRISAILPGICMVTRL